MKINQKLSEKMRAAHRLLGEYRPFLEKQFDVDLSDVQVVHVDRLKKDARNYFLSKYSPILASLGGFIGGIMASSGFSGGYHDLFDRIYIDPNAVTIGGKVGFLGKPTLEQTMMHELSHAVFRRLSNSGDGVPTRDERYWGEGFACYSENYLSHLHPNVELTNGPFTPYRREKASVEKLVGKKGLGVLKEIPRTYKALVK